MMYSNYVVKNSTLANECGDKAFLRPDKQEWMIKAVFIEPLSDELQDTVWLFILRPCVLKERTHVFVSRLRILQLVCGAAFATFMLVESSQPLTLVNCLGTTEPWIKSCAWDHYCVWVLQPRKQSSFGI